MAANEIHINDVGTEFKLTISDAGAVVDLSPGGTTITVNFRKPDGTCFSKSADIVDAANGIVRYITESGDLDTTGTWKLQAFVDFGTTEFYSDIHSFRVHKNICT